MFQLKFAALFAMGFLWATSSQAEEFTLNLKVKTGNKKFAGTNEPVYFAVYYRANVEVPGSGLTGNSRIVQKVLRSEAMLNNKGNDRRVGAIDVYDLKFECPLEDIHAFEIGFKSGVDAWFLNGMQYTIAVGEKESKPITIRFSGWISADAREKGGARGARQSYRFKVRPPKLYPKERVIN